MNKREEKNSVHDIVRAYIKENSYDGLWNPESDFACWRDDLAPDFIHCKGLHGCYPAYILSNGKGDYHGSLELSDTEILTSDNTVNLGSDNADYPK